MNIYTQYVGFPEEPGRLPEKEVMRIAGMKKNPSLVEEGKKDAKHFRLTLK